MTADATDQARAGLEEMAAAFEAGGFAAIEFDTRLVGEDGSTDSRRVAGYGCEGLGVHPDGDYWRVVALDSGMPLGLMPTVSATLRLCTRILQAEGWPPAGPPDAASYARIRDLQAEIIAEEAAALRQRADALAAEIDHLQEKATDFQVRAMLGALPRQGPFSTSD